MQVIEKTITLPDGRTIVLETGKLAKQADGSVMLKMGNTVLLATVVSAPTAGEDVDFMPLTVDYREKYSAAGRIPGGYFKREMKASDYEILVSRLIDRALRPLFPDDYHADTIVNVILYSGEKEEMPDALAGLAASAALSVSDIPFGGPISEVRVARIDGQFVINPRYSDLERADLDLMVGATRENILMVEGEMNEVSEEVMIEAIRVAHEEIKRHCDVQMAMAEALGIKKRAYCHETNDDNLKQRVRDFCYEKAYTIAKSQLPKQERSAAFESLLNDFWATIPEEDRPALKMMVNRYYHAVEKDAMRNMILEDKVRLDGRKTDQIRPIWSEIDCLPRAHGSSIFTRGETQALCSVTLGTMSDKKMIDEVLYEGEERFTLHYNFPPFATGEARPTRAPGRREIGHGNLALRALKNMLPPESDFPYAIRIVSDILESNGSSSMATVCAGTLALMDAGVQMRKPVSGIAMGLISDSTNKRFAILSDILGDEDHLGDMDFKVTGTKDGITATQMDIKVDGLPYEVLAQALEQARQGRMHILGKITETIQEPRADLKAHSLRYAQIAVDPDKIGLVIGSGGKTVQEIQRETGTKISNNDEGLFVIYGSAAEAVERARERIAKIAAVPELNAVYHGIVKQITPYGAFVEFMPKCDGLLHVSEIDWKRVTKVEDYFKVGDAVDVKLIDIDKVTKKYRLSRKALLPKPESTNSSETK